MVNYKQKYYDLLEEFVDIVKENKIIKRAYDDLMQKIIDDDKNNTCE